MASHPSSCMQCALRKANLFCGDFVHGLLDAGEIGIAFSQRNVAHAAVAFVFGDIGIGLGHITACTPLGTAVLAVVPQALGNGVPCAGALFELGAELARVFGVLEIGGFGAGGFHHFGQLARVLVNGAGAQQVVAVEGLVVVILHEQRAAQCVEQRHLADVGVGVVREHARLDIAVGVDVQVTSPARDAAAYEFAVVLEVKREQRLLFAHFADEVEQVLALLGRGHELGRGVVADGHEREDPSEQGALFDEPVEELFGGNGIGVLGRVAARHAERQLVLAQKLHGLVNLGERAVAATHVRSFADAFNRDGGDEVLHANHFLAEVLVDERGVREREERTILVLFAQAHEVLLAHERLAAGVDVNVGAEFLALADDGIDLVVRELDAVPVFRRPATGAVQVAGARGVEQDGPGHVAAQLLAVGFLHGPGQEVAVDEERLYELGHDLGVEVHKLDEQLIPVVFFGNELPERATLVAEEVLGENAVGDVHDPLHVGLGVG